MNNLVRRPKSADIIDLDEDDSTLPPHFSPPASRKRTPTTLETDDDLKLLAENQGERTHCELKIVFEDH